MTTLYQNWNSPNTVDRCNRGPAEWLTNGTERQRPDGHDRVECLSGWRPRFRLNYNELTNRAALSSLGGLQQHSPVDASVSAPRGKGFLALWPQDVLTSLGLQCVHALPVAPHSRPWVVRKETVIWRIGQLETGTGCFESTSYGVILKNYTRCYGALLSSDNGMKGYPLGYQRVRGSFAECYLTSLMLTKDPKRTGSITTAKISESNVVMFHTCCVSWPAGATYYVHVALINFHYLIDTI